MKITDIKQQVKRKDRYSIYGDGKYILSLSERELLNLSLVIGQEFSETQLKDLQQTATLDKAFDQALNLIMRRPRSRWEMETYLKNKKYSPEQIATVLQILEEKSYINDADFARRWIESRRLLKNSSKRKLMMELRQKRVSDGIITSALEGDDTNEKDVLRELIDKKRTQPRYQDKQKLMAYLSRQGFNYDDIKSVLEEA